MSVNRKALCKIGLGAILMVISTLLYAADRTIGDVATDMSETMGGIATLIGNISYVAGVGFALMGVMQFKAHKDNPVQVPLSKPIVYLMIATFLLFLPSVIDVAGSTVLGKDRATASKIADELN